MHPAPPPKIKIWKSNFVASNTVWFLAKCSSCCQNLGWIGRRVYSGYRMQCALTVATVCLQQGKLHSTNICYRIIVCYLSKCVVGNDLLGGLHQVPAFFLVIYTHIQQSRIDHFFKVFSAEKGCLCLLSYLVLADCIIGMCVFAIILYMMPWCLDKILIKSLKFHKTKGREI